MGGNRRYPGQGEHLREERELKAACARGPLQTLSEDQLALHRDPVTVVPDRVRIPARAWLRFGDTDVRANVQIRRWTDRAVGVELQVDGETLRCWVWRGACDTDT